MENKTAIIIGATGLVGKFCLSYLLNENAYHKVIAISRKPIGFAHPKLDNLVIDFDTLADYQDRLVADDIYCCLGTTINVAGSRAAFKKVDFEYPLTLAQIVKKNGAKQFLLVSAIGADKNSKLFYSAVKGELEEAIKNLNFETAFIFQPSFLKGIRKEFRLAEKIALVLMPFFEILMIGPLKKYKSIDAMVVANGMYLKAQSGIKGVETLSSDQIQALWKKK